MAAPPWNSYIHVRAGPSGSAAATAAAWASASITFHRRIAESPIVRPTGTSGSVATQYRVHARRSRRATPSIVATTGHTAVRTAARTAARTAVRTAP
ncbi:hypothetical protein CXF37_07915, partial [Corynebacterium bovis]